MSDSAPLLEVKDLKLHFPYQQGWGPWAKHGKIHAVDGVDFSIRPGETLGLVGESGCGKSSTARAVAQLHRPTSGEVLFKGQDLTKLSHRELMLARRHVQMVFQDPYASLDPRMTAGECIAEPLKIFRRNSGESISNQEIADKVEALMQKVGLSPRFRNRFPHEFSGGQRQRIGIARSLALSPELILADEPVSALDVSIQAQILNLFRDIQEESNLTYLFIAHDLAVIQYISTRVAVMYLGVMVEVAPSAELYKKPLHPYTEALLSAAPIPEPRVERQRNRIILQGDVPAPDKVRTGCYFHYRCPKRMPKCAERIPALKTIDGDHQVACFLYHDESRVNASPVASASR
jgi:oligopeptide transport system ATP-binding protein